MSCFYTCVSIVYSTSSKAWFYHYSSHYAKALYTLVWTLIASSSQFFLLHFNALSREPVSQPAGLLMCLLVERGMPLPALGNPEAFNCWVTVTAATDGSNHESWNVLSCAHNEAKQKGEGCTLSFWLTCFTSFNHKAESQPWPPKCLHGNLAQRKYICQGLSATSRCWKQMILRT